MRSYRNVVKFVSERPWAILPGTLQVIVELVALRANGERLSDEEIAERIGAAPAKRTPTRSSASNTVAVIPIHGVIVPKADMFTKMSGGTSITDLRSSLREAMSDPDIGSIVFDVDSPGGQTDLVAEFAQEIRAARATGRKPILASSNTLMASAAYWLSSQADEVSVSPSSLTGSIGVIAAHDDLSAAQEKVGVKTTLITAGKYKAEANSLEPLSEDARAHLQSLVDDMYQTFTRDVAAGRGASVDAVRNGFGEGRVLGAKDAVKQGLADHVATLEQTIARASELAAAPGRAKRAAFIEAPLLTAGPVAPHSTKTTDEPWDGPANRANLPSPLPVSTAKAAHAWIDDAQIENDTLPKSAAKFIHHEVASGGAVGAANTNGCSAGIAVLNGGRGGSGIPDSDRKGVWNHLARHLRDAGQEPPPLKSFEDLDLEADAGGVGSVEDEIALLCMAERLVMEGRHLTAAKRGRLEAHRARVDRLLAAKPSDPPLDVQVAAMRARLRIAATTLRNQE